MFCLYEASRLVLSKTYLIPSYKPFSEFSVIKPHFPFNSNSSMPEHAVVITGSSKINASVTAVLYPSLTDEQTKYLNALDMDRDSSGIPKGLLFH